MHTPPERPCPEDGTANRPPLSPGAPSRRPRLWLIGGTGEGPWLADRLLRVGWRLRVSVVTAAAGRAYPRHQDLELAVGALGAAAGESPALAVHRELRRARDQADPFTWVVDATHPFALQISAALADACGELHQPLLRLQRPAVPPGGAVLLDHLADLSTHCRSGERLLLAIGARRLSEAMAASPAAIHHARVLPSPVALRQALALGLPADRLACLRPSAASLPVEIALCRHWRIDSVLCRQSGGEGEERWHHICQSLGLRLMLLRRPREPPGVATGGLEELLRRLGSPSPAVKDRG